MGLDTTHDCWRGPYSKFHRWRCWLAQQAGVPLPMMDGFYTGKILPSYYAVHETARWCVGTFEACLPLSWNLLKPDILHTLLSHSDCEGDIPADVCGPLADRLQEIALTAIPPAKDPDFLERLQTFIGGLREAADAGEAVEFH